ncbi:MAG: ABC transporter permease [Coriobacteriales bacterium]|jgi:ABC-type nitrate/sulfonate/bicarbonate transport system permease component
MAAPTDSPRRGDAAPAPAARAHRAMPKALRKVVGYALAFAIVLLGWHLTSIAVDSPALPTPAQTVPMIGRYFGAIAPAFWVSLYRIVGGILIGAVPAVPIGLALGRSRRADAVLAPVLYLLYPVPKIVLLPVLLVLLGLGDAPKIALIALTVFFQVLVSVRDSAKLVPEESILSVRSLGAGRMGVYRHVILPAVMPELFTALRIGSGTAVAVLFLAESFAGSTGLGYFIVDSWGRLAYARMFAGIVAMAALGVLLYAVIDVIEGRLTRWRRAGTGA